MGYLLKEALKTLCGVNQWSYAVFWKTGCQNPKLLIWEECYYGLPGLSGNVDLGIDFQDYDTLSSVTAGNCNLRPDLLAGDKVHLLVNKMMTDSNVKIVGEGLVGRASFTGKYQWMLSENYYREPHPPEVLKEAFQQFSAGIQTVTVIPVLHGVVQFGSHMKILENIGFVNDVLSLMAQLGQIPGVLQSNRESLPLESNTVNASSFSGGCSSQTSVFDGQTSFGSSCYLEPHEAKIAHATNLNFSSRNQFRNVAVKSEVDNPSNGHLNILNFPKKETKKNAIRAHSIPSFVEADKKQKIEHLPNDDVARAIQTPPGDDLFDVLGPNYKNKLFNNFWSSHSQHESEICSSNLDSSILSLTGTDHLLDAVVSKARPLDDNVSSGTTLTSTSGSSVSKAPVPYGPFGDFSRGKGDLFGIPKLLAKAKEDSRTYSQGSCVFDPWAEKGRDLKRTNSVVTGYSNKLNGTSKPTRKRAKPGENPRPRPKDRQMIQDRVKELREIVPNSTKCSIDALLERTIKHMIFLQDVTKHADNLKQTAEAKIISDDGGLLLKDNSGGATWAYEVGSQSMVCPIIVEDLNQPRQMLVEMLCEERGLFLEIADIIRGLGLTILKGLMENRNDKIWARFTVEAIRNVTRMEVFLSLVRLLDQNPKTDIPQPDKIVREFNQAVSGPTTGGCVGIC